MNSKTCQLGAFTSWMVLPETITARLRGSRDRLILRSFWFGHASPWGKETNRWWGSVQRLVCIGFSVILFWWIQNMKTPTACLVRAQKWPLWTQLRGMSDKSRKKPLCSFPSFLQRLSVVVVCFAGCECWEWESSWPSANWEWILNYVLHVFEIPFEPWVSRRSKISPVLHWLGTWCKLLQLLGERISDTPFLSHKVTSKVH